MDQELTPAEHIQRSQRPDIIEREVIGKSPLPRKEHHPQISKISHHTCESNQSVGDHDLPEHYDLENSSSIAPSDIDIICHYKSKLLQCIFNIYHYKFAALTHILPILYLLEETANL